MKKHKTSLVLFDCDGTIVDSEIINAQAMSEILIKLGHEKYTTKYCLQQFIGCSAVEIIQTLETLQIHNPHQTLEQMHHHGIKLAKANLKPIRNASETIRRIKIPKCVVSNGDRKTVLEFLKITQLSEHFKDHNVFTREQVSKPKPSPDLYLFAAEKLNIAPSNCLVIEDSIIGTTSAKKAGMKVLGFTGANSFHENMTAKIKDAGADHIIHDLLEILNYI